MTQITQRKKLSKGTLVLLVVIFVAIIVLAVTGILGYWDTGIIFREDIDNPGFLVGTMIFGSSSYMNAIIVIGLSFLGGVAVCFLIYRYIGKTVTVQQQAGSQYLPQGQTISQGSQSGNETVIS